MSLIPFILDLADELQDCLGAASMDVSDDFGLGIYPHEPPLQLTSSPPQQRRTRSLLAHLLPTTNSSNITHRHHPYCRNTNSSSTNKLCCYGKEQQEKEISATGATVASKSSYSVLNKNGFQVSMNVKQFAPDELLVKTVDNCIVVEGRHEEKEDGHGVISRHFVRKYQLPKGYEPIDVSSVLSTDGILTVKAPPPNLKRHEPQERVVHIQPTGEPAQISSASKEVYKVPLIKVGASSSVETEAAEPITELQAQMEQESTEENGIGSTTDTTTTSKTSNILYTANENETEMQIETANETDNEIESAAAAVIAAVAVVAEETNEIAEIAAIANVTEKTAINDIIQTALNDVAATDNDSAIANVNDIVSAVNDTTTAAVNDTVGIAASDTMDSAVNDNIDAAVNDNIEVAAVEINDIGVDDITEQPPAILVVAAQSATVIPMEVVLTADVVEKTADETNNGTICTESEMLDVNIKGTVAIEGLTVEDDAMNGSGSGSGGAIASAEGPATVDNGNRNNIDDVVAAAVKKDVTLDADIENLVVVQPPIEETPAPGDLVAAAAADAAILLAKAQQQQQQQCENGNQIQTEEVAN